MRGISLAVGGVAAAFTAVLAFAPSVAVLAAPPADGAAVYTRCAACHTATGVGVPGSYPPLRTEFRKLAAKPDGRRYLQLAVMKGLNGPISVEGKSYRGMMPAQPLDDASISAVLNHIGTTVSKTGPTFKAFSAAEVAATRSKAGSLKSSDIPALRPGKGG